MFKKPHRGARRNQMSVVVGVDTHLDVHHAAVVEAVSARPLGDAEFPATPAGYEQLLEWAGGFGTLLRAGIEQTGTYGAGLSQRVHGAGIEVIEINHIAAGDRFRHGKTDQLDAYRAATAAAAGTQTGWAKQFHPAIAALRVMLIARGHHKSSRQRVWGRITGMLVNCPESLRRQVAGLTRAEKLDLFHRWRPDPSRIDDLVQATKLVLRDLAREHLRHDQALADYDQHLTRILSRLAPTLLAQPQVGPVTAAQLLVTAGHPGRIRSEAAFAKLIGVAPIPVKSGKSGRDRLSRAGDRHANSAVHLVTIGRMRTDQRSKDYITRTKARGKTHTEAIRALKRHITRDLWNALETDLNNLPNTT